MKCVSITEEEKKNVQQTTCGWILLVLKKKNRVEEIILGILNFHEWLFPIIKIGYFTFIVEQHMFYKLVLL